VAHVLFHFTCLNPGCTPRGQKKYAMSQSYIIQMVSDANKHSQDENKTELLGRSVMRTRYIKRSDNGLEEED